MASLGLQKREDGGVEAAERLFILIDYSQGALADALVSIPVREETQEATNWIMVACSLVWTARSCFDDQFIDVTTSGVTNYV